VSTADPPRLTPRLGGADYQVLAPALVLSVFFRHANCPEGCTVPPGPSASDQNHPPPAACRGASRSRGTPISITEQRYYASLFLLPYRRTSKWVNTGKDNRFVRDCRAGYDESPRRPAADPVVTPSRDIAYSSVPAACLAVVCGPSGRHCGSWAGGYGRGRRRCRSPAGLRIRSASSTPCPDAALSSPRKFIAHEMERADSRESIRPYLRRPCDQSVRDSHGCR